jgi:hypothetical protein
VVLGEPDNPVDIGSLRVDGIVVNPKDPTDFIQKFGRLTFGGGRHRIFLQSRQTVGFDIRDRAKLPVNPVIITLSGQ